MKRIIYITALLFFVLPVLAQQTFSLRVRMPKNYPYEIKNIDFTIYFIDKTDGVYQEYHTPLRDGWDFTGTFEINELAFIDFKIYESIGSYNYSYPYRMIPAVPGEKAVVTVIDSINYEVSGSRMYREYGKARKAIIQDGVNVKEYVMKHRKEKGCCLYLRSLYDRLNSLDGIPYDSLDALFDVSVQEYFKPKSMNKKQFILDVASTFRLPYSEKNRPFHTLDRYIEGETLLDSIRERCKGKISLLCLNFLKISDKTEFLFRTQGLNVVTLLNPVSSRRNDMQLQSETANFPFEHYLIMGYQHQSLCNLFQFSDNASFILLDTNGEIIGKAGNRKEYLKLLQQLDCVRKENGLLPPQRKPYTNKPPRARFLDVDVTTDWIQLSKSKTTFSHEERAQFNIVNEARRRMEVVYKVNKKLDDHYKVGVLSAKKLKISQRLYDYLKTKIEENNAIVAKKEKYAEETKHRRSLGDKEADEPFDTTAFPVGKAVDLGLSVLWADMNVGAKAPEQSGYFYAWGEVSPVPDVPVDWETYKWCYNFSLTKYCTKRKNGANRYVDNLTTLQPCDDAATVRWGSKWRIPTADELQELCDKCTWEWTTVNGQNGNRVTGPNGNSIFLPATGMYNYSGYDLALSGNSGYIWSSTLNPENPDCTSSLRYRSTDNQVQHGTTRRHVGITIRPVQDK